MALNVELEDLLVEAFTPASSEDIDVFSLSDRSCVGKREEEFGGEDCPFVGLGGVDLYGAESFLAIISSEDIYLRVADNCCKGTSWGI